MNRIKFRRGSLNNKKNIDIEDGEPIYLTDTKRLYVSNEDVAINNVYVGSQEPNDPGINVWIDPQGINSGVIDMIHPIGSIYISATNTDPSSTFGGTWELVDKEFKPLLNNTNSYFTATDNVELMDAYVMRTGHNIKMRVSFYNKVELGDSTVNIGTVDYTALGCSGGISFGLYYLIGASDGGSGVIEFQLNWNTGALNSVDVITKTNTTIPVDSSCYVLLDILLVPDLIDDSACDKFYWKRVS